MRYFSILAMLLAAGLVGCANRSQPGGGSNRSQQISISGPMTAPSLRQGETQTVTLTLNRGNDFKQNVNLKAEAPAGIDASLGSPMLKASDQGEFMLKLTAKDNAQVGSHKVVVSAAPETGTAATYEMTVKVSERADRPTNDRSPTVNDNPAHMSLAGPLLATNIKQGETQTIDLSLRNVDRVKHDVMLKVENPPKGITTEFTVPSVKVGDTGKFGLKVTADKTAALGSHVLHVTGKTEGGTVDAADVKINVTEP